ncbi:hypothetical protein V500_04258 [Pseudogymnoascus sp. VKM F-4518 (FW-2643)]|nr:hypothetical protein V500_04258 [Pseudogymnoascus sp. VKM F-4518 (FW-2643)]
MTSSDTASDDGDSQESIICDKQNFDDIVTTEGACLVPRSNTPIYPGIDEVEFTDSLDSRLNALVLVQLARAEKYGKQDSGEWPIGHTPPAVVEIYEARMRELEALMDASTPTSCSDDDYGDDGAKGNIKQEKGPAAAGEPTPPPPPLLPTPSPSNLETPYSESDIPKAMHPCEVSPITTSDQVVYMAPQRRKRGREPAAEHGEQRPTKIRATTTCANQDAIGMAKPPCDLPSVGAFNNTAHKNPRRKQRRRDLEADNEVEQPRLTKTRVAATKTRPRNRTAREIERATHPESSFTAATSPTATDAAKEKCTQTSQKIPKSLQSTNEISNIAAEQKTAGNSRTESTKRNPIATEVELRPSKYRRTGEAEEMVVRTSGNSRTTRIGKRKLPTEDTQEPRLDGKTGATGARSRKRRKAIDDNDGGSPPVVARNWVGSAVTTDSQPRQWAKRMLCGTPSVAFRAERLKTLRPRVDDKVVISSGLMTGAARKVSDRLRSNHNRSNVT